MNEQNMTHPEIRKAERYGGGVDPRGEKQPELTLREKIIDVFFDVGISLVAERIEDNEKIMEFSPNSFDEATIEVKIVEGQQNE